MILLKKIDDEIDYFIEGSGPFQNRIDVDDNLPAGMYWRRKSPKGLLITNYASRIVDGSPSTSAVERFHYKFSRVRTKQRNKLNYDRCEKLVFLNSALQGSTNCNEKSSWCDMIKSFQFFEAYSSDDDQYLDDFLNRINQTLLDNEEEEHSHSDSSDNSDNSDGGDVENSNLELSDVATSKFGRKIVPKVYQNYFI